MSETFHPRLNCVAIPLLRHDLSGAFLEILHLWNDRRCLPRVSTTAPMPHLMVMVNNAPPEELAAAEMQFYKFDALASCFSGITVLSADLVGDRDLYVKGEGQRVGEFGSRAGPNFLFQATMNAAARYGGFCLQLELDCLPLQSGWIEATQKVVDGHASAWVVGTHFAGEGLLDRTLQTHLNGNALYRAGDPLFQEFLDEVWLPRVLEHTKTFVDLAYDCWWAYELTHSDPMVNNKGWELFKKYNGFFHSSHFITNLLVNAQQSRDYLKVMHEVLEVGVMPIFFHGPALNAIRTELVMNPKESIFNVIDRMSV